MAKDKTTDQMGQQVNIPAMHQKSMPKATFTTPTGATMGGRAHATTKGDIRMAPGVGGEGAREGKTGNMPGQPGEPKKKHTVRTIIIVLLCVLLAVGIWLAVWLFACNGASLFDQNAQTGQAPYKSAEEIQAELDRVVDEGMFNISIASVISFDNGTSPGTAYIENVPGNRYLMKVDIVEDESGETLYESGILKPNQYIEDITLSKDLDAGTYMTTATFTALDETTYEEVGQAAAKVTINVLE